MAFASLILRTRNINKLVKILDDEKQKSVEASREIKSTFTARQKFRHFWLDQRYRLKKCLKRFFGLRKGCYMHRLIYKVKYDGTCENFTIKSVAGFIGGFLLTYVFFMFFVLQLNFKLSTATIMCAIFGSILTIGLAFSYKVRCVVFLLLPQFFSKRGRQALMAYAFILAITGPAKNTLNNMGILSESLACGQEQLKSAVRQIVELIKKPFYAIRDAVKTVVKTIKVIVKKLKEIMLTIKRIVLGLVRVIRAAFQFLAKILNICNKELGTPFQRCTRAFEDAITDCNAKLGPFFNWLCSITYIVQSVCYIVKILDFICMIIDFISDSIVGIVFKKIKMFVRHIKTMFYVKIKFSHSFHFENNQSRSMNEVAEGIVTEVRQRTERLLAVFDFMSCATSLFFLVIIVRVLHYRYKFLTSDRFDNRFITRNFRNIDMRRAQLEKETILPLNHRERAFYINVNSIRLVKIEKLKVSKATVALLIITLKLSTHMIADYSLYWVLMIIRYHARFQSKVQAPNVVGLRIQGEGFIASLLRSIVSAFQPLGLHLEIDTIPCLPDPIPPDYDRYIQIATLLLLCWVLTILEPYGLRLRHSVMCYYHPIRARQRAIWLYNHIIRSRCSFLKYARRQLRKKVAGSKGIAKVTFKEYLRANINTRWLRICLGSDEQEACLLCGEVFRESDSIKPIRCSKPGCPGIYCQQCFADLQNLCTVCLEPIQYGDLSDISEEKDSSENEYLVKQKKRRKRKCKISKCLSTPDEGDSDDIEDDMSKGSRALLPSNNDKSSHSDYETEFDTDNSYTYQKTKSLADEINLPDDVQFRDVEKQEIPDYASWDESREFFNVRHDIINRRDPSYVSVSTSSDDFEVILLTAEKQHKETPKIVPLFSNRNADSSTTESQLKIYAVDRGTESLRSSFDARVKYDVVNESEKSSTNSYVSSKTTLNTTTTNTTASSRRSSNIDYNIYRRDTYIEYEKYNVTEDRTKQFINVERDKRLKEIMYNSRYKKERVSKSKSISEYEESSSMFDTNSTNSSLTTKILDINNQPYKTKIKSYYKQINKTITDKSIIRTETNSSKFVGFFKKFFKRNNNRNGDYQLKELKNSETTFTALSSKPYSASSISKSNQSSASSEEKQYDSSVPPSTRSTETSLMGSAESFSSSVDKNQVQILDTSNALPNTEDFSSSDSEITDLDVYFRQSVSCESLSNVTPENKKTRTVVTDKETVHSVTRPSLREETPRFSREPPERDEDFTVGCIMSDNAIDSDSNLSPVDGETDKQTLINKSRCSSFPVKIEKNYNPDVSNKACSDSRSSDPNYPRKNKTYGRGTEKKCNRNVSGKDNFPERIRYSRAEELYRCSYKPLPPPLPTIYQNTDPDKIFVGVRKSKKCPCENCQRKCEIQNYEELGTPQVKSLHSGDDDASCCSDYSSRTRYPELVYQQTEEYLDLVNELGETLSLRNKNRVETTIREFEYLSRQNKSLHKPLFDDDEDEQPNMRQKNCCCCNCCCKRPQTCQPTCNSKFESDRENKRSAYRQHKILKQLSTQVDYPDYQRPRWQKDHRTGKWYKTFDDSDFGDGSYRLCGRMRYSSVSPPPSPNRKICGCEKCVHHNIKCTSRDDGSINSSTMSKSNCEYPCDMWF